MTIQTGLKLAAIAACGVLFFDGRHPPVQAQQAQYAPPYSTEDSLQDERIHALNEHLASTDARVQKQWDLSNTNASNIVAVQTEIRVWGSAVGLLITGGFFLNRKKPA